MGTSILTDTVVDPGGNVVATSSGTVVNFRLMANGSPTSGFRISDNANVASLLVTSASTTGGISQALENNSNIVPTGTYYVAEILCPSSQGGTQEWALISSSSAATQTFHQALAAVIPSFTPITSVPPTILSGNNTFTGTNSFANVSWKAGPTYEPVAYGAVGNGAGDDSMAIQAAINAAEASTAGWGVVDFGSGYNYRITSGVTVHKSNMVLKGDSTITAAAAVPILTIGNGNSVERIRKAVVRDLVLDCNTTGTIGVQSNGTVSLLIEGIKVINATGPGIDFAYFSAGFIGGDFAARVIGCYIFGCGDHAIKCHRDNNGMLFAGNTIHSNFKGIGISMDGAGSSEGLYFLGNEMSWNGPYSINLNYGDTGAVIQGYFEDGQPQAIEGGAVGNDIGGDRVIKLGTAHGPVYGVTIENCWMATNPNPGNANYGIECVNGAVGMDVHGNNVSQFATNLWLGAITSGVWYGNTNAAVKVDPATKGGWTILDQDATYIPGVPNFSGSIVSTTAGSAGASILPSTSLLGFLNVVLANSTNARVPVFST